MLTNKMWGDSGRDKEIGGWVNTETSFDEVPKVKARAIRCRYGVWDLYITCPYCGKKHHHGGGDGERPILGNRVCHCVGPAHKGLQEYELV